MHAYAPSMLRMIIVGVDMDCKISRKHIMVEGVEFIRNQAVRREVSKDWQSTEFGIWVDRRILRRILNGRLDAVLLF